MIGTEVGPASQTQKRKPSPIKVDQNPDRQPQVNSPMTDETIEVIEEIVETEEDEPYSEQRPGIQTQSQKEHPPIEVVKDGENAEEEECEYYEEEGEEEEEVKKVGPSLNEAKENELQKLRKMVE